MTAAAGHVSLFWLYSISWKSDECGLILEGCVFAHVLFKPQNRPYPLLVYPFIYSQSWIVDFRIQRGPLVSLAVALIVLSVVVILKWLDTQIFDRTPMCNSLQTCFWSRSVYAIVIWYYQIYSWRPMIRFTDTTIYTHPKESLMPGVIIAGGGGLQCFLVRCYVSYLIHVIICGLVSILVALNTGSAVLHLVGIKQEWRHRSTSCSLERTLSVWFEI
jgi:hypothetical protein